METALKSVFEVGKFYPVYLRPSYGNTKVKPVVAECTKVLKRTVFFRYLTRCNDGKIRFSEVDRKLLNGGDSQMADSTDRYSPILPTMSNNETEKPSEWDSNAEIALKNAKEDKKEMKRKETELLNSVHTLDGMISALQNLRNTYPELADKPLAFIDKSGFTSETLFCQTFDVTGTTTPTVPKFGTCPAIIVRKVR